MYRSIEIIVYGLLMFTCASAISGQDPMRPPNWGNTVEVINVSAEKINLQQILISKTRKIAVVNDQVVKEGQKIAGVTVVKIETNQIKIKRGGVVKTIKLLPATKGVNREL